MCSPCLPAEVWTLVFRHLSLSDRLRVRASCKHFRDLVDTALWRNRTVELKKRGEEYEEDFWSTLRRWRVTSVRLSAPYNWTHIATKLPELTSVIVHLHDMYDESTNTRLQDLRSFTSLERLHLTIPTDILLEELSPVLPQRLIHLRVCQCDIVYRSNALPTEVPPDSSLKKLKSLVFHSLWNSHPVNVLHFFLSSLPQLQNLCLSVNTQTSFKGQTSDLPPLHNCSLSSLKLLGCSVKRFPTDFMKMLSTSPFLRRLAIHCCYDDDDDCSEESQKLSAWLKDLPTLTSLTVECLYFDGFVESIPSSVTRLALWPYHIDHVFTALPAQLLNLHHLHLELLVPCDPDLEADDPRLGPCSEMALIPQLFPRLKTLRLSHALLSDVVFLSLASLKELEVLEVLEISEVQGHAYVDPLSDALISKFRELTNSRLRIYKKSEEQLQTCGCCYDPYGPTDDWA